MQKNFYVISNMSLLLKVLKNFIILEILLGFSTPLHAEALQNFTTYASLDYTDYKKSSFTSPSWDPFVEEGFQAFDKQDTSTAIEFLRKAVSLGCRSPLVLFKLALSHEAQGSYYSAIQYYELAEEQFKKAHQDHRYRKEFYENYGRALYMMGQTDRALPYLEKALVTSQSYWILKVLGQLSLDKGNLTKASQYFEQALKLNDPQASSDEWIPIYLQLARGYLKQEDKVTAKHYYEKTLEIDPKNQEAKNFLQEIQKQEVEEKAFKMFD